MNRILRRANKRVSLGSAAALIAVAGLTGAILGVLRTRLINTYFPGAGSAPYFVAFEIPDFIFFTLASGALGVAFLPALSDKLQDSNRKSAWELSNSVLNFIAIISGLATIIMIIFARPLIHYVVAPNLSPERLNQAVSIMRLVAINPFIFSISTVLTSVQQGFGRFFFYAVAPLFYNASIIASIYIFKDSIGIIGIGYGVLFGSLLQLIVSIFGLSGMGFSYRPKIDWKNKSFIGVLKALPARSIDQGIDYINSISETRFASRLGDISISYYKNAFILHTVPINLIGIAISTAAFPRFTERIAQGRPDLFRKEFLQVLRAMIWIATPVVVVSFFARGYLARIIFFSRDAREISVVFGFLIAAIFFRTMYSIISRYFYAQKDTRTPLLVSLFTIALNIFLAWSLSSADKYGVAGLALAQSIVATVEVLILLTIMVLRDHKLLNGDFWNALFRIFSVTGYSALAAFAVVTLIPVSSVDKAFTILLKLALVSIVTFGIHIAMSWLYQLDEVRPLIEKTKKFALKSIRIQ
jgi:putative peptidoglycan lipid II flippase